MYSIVTHRSESRASASLCLLQLLPPRVLRLRCRAQLGPCYSQLYRASRTHKTPTIHIGNFSERCVCIYASATGMIVRLASPDLVRIVSVSASKQLRSRANGTSRLKKVLESTRSQRIPGTPTSKKDSSNRSCTLKVGLELVIVACVDAFHSYLSSREAGRELISQSCPRCYRL